MAKSIQSASPFLLQVGQAVPDFVTDSDSRFQLEVGKQVRLYLWFGAVSSVVRHSLTYLLL